LAALICSEFGQRELNRQISGGNREGLNYQQVRAMALPWPQDATIRAEMASVIQAAKLEIEALEAELVKLRQQKQGLMHDLLTGKTGVFQ
jgi:type I restriction enzyme S subunit